MMASSFDGNTIGPVRTVDYHAGGQPIRIVLDGGPDLPGVTAAEKRAHAMASAELDAHRKFLCFEPRGHADMYACYVFQSGEPDCDFGAVFAHNIGYPPSCGHGSIALGAYAVESGLVAADPDGETLVTIEVPAGRALVRVRRRGGAIEAIWLDRGLSYPRSFGQCAQTSAGPVAYDLVFSGALMACVNATTLGVPIDAEHHASLMHIARQLLSALNAEAAADNILDERLNGVFGVIFYEEARHEGGVLRQRAVNIFNDGWVERSPGAAMVGACLALLSHGGELAEGETILHESISGATANARMVRVHESEHPGAVRARVELLAHRTGEHVFTASEADALAGGFSLRTG